MNNSNLNDIKCIKMSQLFDANIQQWVQFFSEAYKQNPRGIDFDESIFSENAKNDLPLFLSICNEILLLQDDNEDLNTAKELSSFFLKKVLNYQDLDDLKEKRSIIPSESVEQIKNVLKQNIFSDNPTIRSNCAEIYSLLFSILTTNWEEGIDDIVNLFNNSTLLPYGFIILYSIMIEIINSKIFLTEIFPFFHQQFTQVLVISIDILSKEFNESIFIPELRIEACKYVHDIIKLYPGIFNDDDENDRGTVVVSTGSKIPFLLDVLPNSFEINDFDLYENLIDLLNIIVEKFYSQSMNFMQTISDYILYGINLVEVDQRYPYLSIKFWLQVAIFEDEIIEKCRCSSNPEEEIQPLQPLLSEIEFESLLQFYVNYVEFIDVDDVNVENNQRTKVHQILISTLKSIYKIVPSTFNIIKEVIEIEISKDKWINVYSGILLLYTICNEPFDEEVGSYLVSQMDLLIQCSVPDQIPRLRYNSLLVIGLIFQNYPHIILEQEELADKWIQQLIDIFQATLQIDEKHQRNISEDNCSIFERYAKIIYSIATLWYNEPIESRLPLYFEKFYEIIDTLFNLAIFNNFLNLIEKSSDALNRLISYSTVDMIGEFGALYQKTLEELLQLKSSLAEEEEETFSFAASCYCSNLTTMLIELKNNGEIISQFAEQTIHVLFETLEIKNEKLWKEIFWAIASLIIAANSTTKNKIDVFTPYTFNLLYENFINTAFTSNDPELIRATCCLISNIYLYLSKQMNVLHQLIPDIFEILVVLITTNEMKDAYPFILEAISNMFSSVDQNDELINQLEEIVFELLFEIVDLSNELDITNDNEVDYYNLLYQYLCDVATNYAKIYLDSSDLNHEKEQLSILDRLAFFILNLNPKISDDLFRSFMLSVSEFASKCSKQNKCILKNKYIIEILELGYENCTQLDVSEKMKEVYDIINVD